METAILKPAADETGHYRSVGTLPLLLYTPHDTVDKGNCWAAYAEHKGFVFPSSLCM